MPTQVKVNRSQWVAVSTLAFFACTYGSVEQSAAVGQVLRLGDTYRALAVVQRDEFQSPTGLSAFPDGGKRKLLERHTTVYLLDVKDRLAEIVADLSAPDDVWESFSVRIRALDGDSAAYLRMTGCPRNGECHPRVQREVTMRLTLTGDLEEVERVPPELRLPGSMLARRPNEQNYMRLGIDRDGITATFEEGASFEAVFALLEDGSLIATGG